jgi:glyoxylase-like metal-dependent hydrolase (beta-lactamase superfamily II)
MLGSEGVACVVDPQRDVELYIDEARKQGLRIEHIIETHLHADFVSGHRELADRTGAKIYLGAAAGATFPHVAVHEGDEIRFGRAILRFLETPGHTLESVSVAVTDLDRGEKPFASADRRHAVHRRRGLVPIFRRITRRSSLPGCSTTACTRN